MNAIRRLAKSRKCGCRFEEGARVLARRAAGELVENAWRTVRGSDGLVERDITAVHQQWHDSLSCSRRRGRLVEMLAEADRSALPSV